MSNPFVRAVMSQKATSTQDLDGSADPSAASGVAAPVGSTYRRTSDGALWQKTGSGDTAWTKLVNTTLLGTTLPVAVLSGAADPSAGGGVAATRPALYVRTGTDELYLKTGAGDTGWTKMDFTD